MGIGDPVRSPRDHRRVAGHLPDGRGRQLVGRGGRALLVRVARILRDFLVRRQPLAGQKITAIIAQLAIMALAILVFIWGGIRALTRAWGQQMSSLPGTVGMMYTVLPITGVLILFYAIFHTIQIIRDEEPPYVVDDADPIAQPAVTGEPVSHADDAQAPKKPQENL